MNRRADSGGAATGGEGGVRFARPHVVVFGFVAVAMTLGWAHLLAMVAAMMANTDMAELGPGMGVLNRINGFADFPDEVKAALSALCGPSDRVWSAADWASVAAMWVAMVAAMMLPTAIPVFRAYADLAEEKVRAGERVVSGVVLALGYLAIWVVFALVATAAQGLLTQASLMNPVGASASRVLTATTLLAAGLYQFTPLKWACLARCRAPRPFFADAWTNRVGGVFRQGIAQGLDCLGCCWALMTVMFAVGVMNVVWIVLLGAIMTIEKLVPSNAVGRIVGVVFLAWGAALLLASPIGAVLLSRF